MSLESAHLHRPTSPASSGRSSPVYPRARSGAEDGLHAVLTSRLKGLIAVGVNRKDKSYRRYASAVERALSLFDTALQEWADYISFLGRLHKVRHFRPVELRIAHPRRCTRHFNPDLRQSLRFLISFWLQSVWHNVLTQHSRQEYTKRPSKSIRTYSLFWG